MGRWLSRLAALVSFVLVAALAGGGAVVAKVGPKPDKKAVPGDLIVRFAAGVSEDERRELLRSVGAKETGKADRLRIKFAQVDPAALLHAIKRLEDDRRVAYAEPNFVLAADRTPADPSFTQLWGLNNTGQSVSGKTGTADADIDAVEAWDVTTGSPAVTVGVIDTGVDFSHPDLAGAQWINPGEDCTGCRTNGVDDDDNGYVDDWRGWDFFANDNNPFDENSHGTHVAGTIGATGSNGVGVAGVSWNVRIAALRFLDADGYGETDDAVKAILYAAAAGIPITNNSWGGGEYSQALADAIAEADRKGSLFVAAAGNETTNTDGGAHYPSTHASPNIISVAASDSRDALAWFSNFGAKTVDLAAPGENIYSTIPGGGYDWYDGTSMATPHVAGALALAKAAFPSATGAALKALLLRTVDVKSSLTGYTATGGRLNVNNAVRCSGASQLWVEAPAQGFDVAIGENVKVTALAGVCGSPTASVTATADGIPFTLTNRGDGLYTGVFAPAAAGSVTVTVTAGGDTRTLTGTARDNYYYDDAPFQWIDATLGTKVALTADDGSATVSLPFAFSLYKESFTSLKISSNGYLVFGGGEATQYANTGLPNTNQPNGLVAPYWDDLNPAMGGAIWYRTTGTAPTRKFTVAWIGVPHYSYGNVTLEATLEEGTNDIVFSYKDVLHENANVDFGASATVGVENRLGNVGREFLYREPRLQGYENAKSLRFSNRPAAPPDTTAPAVPTGLTAAGGARQVVLDWANNTEADLSGYRVYRNGTLVGSPAASAFTDSGLAAGTSYAYEVSAVDASGNESQRSSSASATTDPPDLVAPSSPTGLVPTAALGSVSLDWADNTESDLAGYRVYRDGAQVGTSTASAFVDTTVAHGTTYAYEVTAYDSSNNESGKSASVSATTPRVPIAKTYQPSGYTILSGAVHKSRGALSRLYADDGSRVEIAGAFNGTQYVSAITASTTIAGAERATLSRLQVDVDAKVSASAAALAISVYNFALGDWVVVDGPRTGVTSDRLVSWVAPGSPTDYVSASGEIRVRVRGTRSSGFRTDTDLVRYVIEY